MAITPAFAYIIFYANVGDKLFGASKMSLSVLLRPGFTVLLAIALAWLGVCKFVLEKREQELQHAISECEQVFNSTGDGLCVIDRNYNIIKTNEAYTLIHGLNGEKAVGKKCHEILRCCYCNTSSCTLSRILAGEDKVKYEVTKKRGDGTTVICTITATPYHDSNGKLIGILENLRDVTRSRRIEAEMHRYDNLNTIGEMAAGIGHEVRNPLTTVHGLLQLLSCKEECSKFKNYLVLMISEIERANSIITKYLTMARERPINPQLQDLNKLIRTIFPLLQCYAINVGKQVDLDLREVPEILLDEKSIRQLILNLVRNAVEATKGYGEITVKTYLNEDVVFAVQDQGEGIDPAIIQRLGDPFFTTKEGGTGLGLAVCNRIVKDHSATMEVQSDKSGTTFSVHFPIVEKLPPCPESKPDWDEAEEKIPATVW